MIITLCLYKYQKSGQNVLWSKNIFLMQNNTYICMRVYKNTTRGNDAGVQIFGTVITNNQFGSGSKGRQYQATKNAPISHCHIFIFNLSVFKY